MEEKRIINPPLFMGFSEGRDTTFGAVRTVYCPLSVDTKNLQD